MEQIIMTEDEWMTVSEAAKSFRVTERTIRNWLDGGLKHKLQKVIGRRERKIIHRLDIEDFLSLGVRDSE